MKNHPVKLFTKALESWQTVLATIDSLYMETEKSSAMKNYRVKITINWTYLPKHRPVPGSGIVGKALICENEWQRNTWSWRLAFPFCSCRPYYTRAWNRLQKYWGVESVCYILSLSLLKKNSGSEKPLIRWRRRWTSQIYMYNNRKQQSCTLFTLCASEFSFLHIS